MYKTAQEAIEKINPFRGNAPFRVHNRETPFGNLIVMAGYFISDIEYALRKDMYEMQSSSLNLPLYSGLINLPTFAGQAACPYFEP